MMYFIVDLLQRQQHRLLTFLETLLNNKFYLDLWIRYEHQSQDYVLWGPAIHLRAYLP